MKRVALLLVVTTILLSACKKDDDNGMPMENFTVTIENVFEHKNFFNAGTADPIPPGSSITFSFNAGKGHYLSFATMLAQSNDLFYGFQDMGLALYDGSGNAVTGDVTGMVYLWDAGTEVNEEPGTGPNQAPRQSGPDTGPDENGTVELLSNVNDGFMYPAVADVIKVMITHDGGTEFTVTIYNKSGMASLTSPLAPGVWVVHSNNVQLFTEGQAAGDGLEKLAEDGNNMVLGDYLKMNAGLVSPFAPGIFAVYHGMNPIFKTGVESSDALEDLAEDGSPAGFDFSGEPTVSEWGTFMQPVSGSGPAPILPGEKYEFTFKASVEGVLSFATMLVQSNDLFVAPEGIKLYQNGQPISGDITAYLKLWDAKTEVNEYPGAGMNQAPRQAGPDTGVDETGTVEVVNDGYTYPDIAEMIKVTISYN